MQKAQVALPLIAVLAMAMFLSFSQSGPKSAEASGPGVSIQFTNAAKENVDNVARFDKFSIQVYAAPAPSFDVRGYAYGVVIPAGGGIKYNGPVPFDTNPIGPPQPCDLELKPNIADNNAFGFCATTHTPTKHSINVIGPSTGLDVDAIGTKLNGQGADPKADRIVLGSFAYVCNTVGTYEVYVIQADPDVGGAIPYADQASNITFVKTVANQAGAQVSATAKLTCGPCRDNDADTLCDATDDPDDDNDGLPDTFENRFLCLDPLVDDAAADPDGDGRTNLEEFQLGSKPCVATVGGIAELPEVAGAPLETGGSSRGNAGVLAAIAALAVTLGGAAWYTRRRWAR